MNCHDHAMDPARRRVPHSTWIALAVATAVVGWLVWWLAGDLVPSDNEPDPASRQYVEARLAEAAGTPMVLPVRLPDGYDHGWNYGYLNDEQATAADGDPTHAKAREVMFMPVEGLMKDNDLPAITLCVEDAIAKRSACPHPGARDAYIQRRHGHALLTVYATSDGNQDLSAWRTLELTTDLDKVTWLH